MRPSAWGEGRSASWQVWWLATVVAAGTLWSGSGDQKEAQLPAASLLREHASSVSWREQSNGVPEEPHWAGAFVPTLEPVAPRNESSHLLFSAEARAFFGLPFCPVGMAAPRLARLSSLSARAAHSACEFFEQHGPLQRASEAQQIPHIGPKTAARLASVWQWGDPPSSRWLDAPHSVTGGVVLRPFLVELLRILPQSGISRLWGWIARVRRPRFAVEWLKATFVRLNGLDMSESLEPIESFACLEDLFVRTLKPGLRPIDEDVQTLVSPVDGHVGASGVVTDGLLLQIKGRSYTLAELLNEPTHARFFEGGAYVTLYLAPKDYHRIHAPQAGHVTSARLVPGLLMPVFPEAVERVDRLFAQNERIISYVKSPDAGGLALVAVGATLVGRMRVNFDASLRGNEQVRVARSERYAKPTWFERGEEMGAFELGSTVVLICQPGMVTLDPLTLGQPVRMGERIGLLQKAPRGRDSGGAPEFLRPADDDEL